jgi:hypothetical protein
MKQKMQYAVQPRQSAPLRNKQVEEEIRNFLRALDSYPARVAKEPRLSFQQHLCSIFARGADSPRDQRARRQ